MHPNNRVPLDHSAHKRADEWLSQMDKLEYRSFEEVAERAQLTEDELTTVRELLDGRAEDRIRRLPPPWHAGTVRAALRMLAYLGGAPNVAGPFKRFARRGLFGRHTELAAFQARGGGFHLYPTDPAEMFSRIFEMELMCFFASAGFDVELKEGPGPDFAIRTETTIIDVEAKAMQIDRALDTVFPDSSWEAIRRNQGKFREQPNEVDLDEVAEALTKSAAGLYDKAMSQCQNSDQYLVALKFPVGTDYYGADLDEAKATWMAGWTEQSGMLGLLLVHRSRQGGGCAVTWKESRARPSLSELFPEGAMDDIPGFLTRFLEDRTANA